MKLCRIHTPVGALLAHIGDMDGVSGHVMKAKRPILFSRTCSASDGKVPLSIAGLGQQSQHVATDQA